MDLEPEPSRPGAVHNTSHWDPQLPQETEVAIEAGLTLHGLSSTDGTLSSM